MDETHKLINRKQQNYYTEQRQKQSTQKTYNFINLTKYKIFNRKKKLQLQF